jgi:putative glutamine amidotransferase
MGSGLNGDARPLIGVTTSEVRRKEHIHQTPQGEPVKTELALGLDYVHAVEAAGGLPVVLPALDPERVEPLLANLSGICLSGGPDLEPAAYGGGRHPRLGPTEPQVDRFELAAARHAIAAEVPLLAVCRGAQALNVACGGTLVQHLPDVVGHRVEHRQSAPARQGTHAITIEAGSLLSRIVGARTLRVNSFHHQAVAELGDGLSVSARSADGVVEAIESRDRGFVLGVQWHAECMVPDPRHAALFGGLVQAARAHTRTKGRVA